MKTEIARKILESVKCNYQAIAPEFNMTRKKEIWPAIRDAAGKVENGNRILDIGCGNGRLLGALEGKDIYYLGADNSEALIELARLNYPDRRFIIADILKLDKIEEADFNKIFCLAVLQHIPSKELRLEALCQMAAKLAAEGEIIISVWNLWRSHKHRLLLFKGFIRKITGRSVFDINDLFFPWKDSRGREVSERYYHAFTKRELEKLARRARLEIVRLDKDDYNYWLILKKKYR